VSNRRRYDNPINQHAAKVLTEIHQIVEAMHRKVDEQKLSLLVLEQAVEMNLWVQMKVFTEDLPKEDPVALVTRVRELQREYLVTVSIVNFIREMATDAQEKPSPEDPATEV